MQDKSSKEAQIILDTNLEQIAKVSLKLYSIKRWEFFSLATFE
jgi:hypothetical protein